MAKEVKLTNITSLQIDKALAKLQIVAPVEYDVEGKVGMLRFSKVFQRGLSDYEDDDIVAMFNSKGTFVDFKTTDGRFDGLFCQSKSNKTMYPCRVCASEVTKNKDSSGFGLECSGCGMFFHNDCAPKQISLALFDALTGSPNYVKLLCPSCNLVYGSADLKLKRIERKVNTMVDNLSTISDTVDKVSKQKPSYSSAIGKSQAGPTLVIPPKLINSLNKLTKTTQVDEDAERLKRTRVVVRPEDTHIRTGRDIRREFNKNHKGVLIKNCRLTAGGNIMFEFSDEATATKVQSEWSNTYFGGNKCMKVPGEDNTIGMVKFVYDNFDEQEMKGDILKNYPDADCEFLKRKQDQRFMGMIKVDFKSRDRLLEVIDDNITICHQRYMVEEYRRKSRVIKCNKCQGWGHIHRYCVKPARCGKCADKHESNTCTITSGFKCAHCGGDHKAGSSDCKTYKEKMAQFANDVDHD